MQIFTFIFSHSVSIFGVFSVVIFNELIASLLTFIEFCSLIFNYNHSHISKVQCILFRRFV
jgi:hypothetical protein